VTRSTQLDDLFACGGKIGQWMERLDWSQTPLGAIAQWPQSLQTALSLCLTARVPMLLWWGSEPVMLYNDAFQALLGGAEASPVVGQVGREGWAEMWPAIAPILEQVRQNKTAFHLDNQRLRLDRGLGLEECYFNLSYSPIFDETGGVGGILTTAIETTDRVVDERRWRSLSALSQRTTAATTVETVFDVAIATLADNCTDIPFALIYRLDATTTQATLTAKLGIAEDFCPDLCSPTINLVSDEGDRSWPIAQAIASNRLLHLNNLRDRWTNLPIDAPKAAIVVPLAQIQPLGALILGVNPQQVFDRNYRRFLELIGSQIGNAIASLPRENAFPTLVRGLESEIDPTFMEMMAYFNALHERDRMQQQLQSSEELNRRIIESSLDCIKVLDVDGRLQSINAGGQALLEICDLDRFLNQQWLEFWQGEGREAAQKAIAAAKAGGNARFQGYCPTQSGTPKWWDVIVTPICGLDGEVKQLLALSRDITELKQTERELRLITDAVPALIAYVNRNGCYRFVNKAYTDWFGRPAESIVGLSVAEFVGAEVYQYMRHDVEAALKGEPVTAEVWMPFKEGGPRYVRRQYIPDFNDQGRVQGFYATISDLTNLKRTEEALRASEVKARARAEELEALMEAVPAAIWIAHDSQCHQMTANLTAYRLMRATPGSISTATPADGSYPLHFKQQCNGKDISPQDLPMQKACSTGEEIEADFEFVFEDGSISYLYGKAIPLRDERGNVRGAIGAFVDISDRKYAEAEISVLLERERSARTEAERANHIKDEFLAILSHELRSPLNPILGWATLLRKPNIDSKMLSKGLKIIERNALLQVQLIDDLLDVSRILRGKLHLNMVAVNLRDAIAAALETVRLAAEAKNIELQTQFDLSEGLVLGDAARLQQIVWNLLSNAVKFTPAGGRVAVCLRRCHEQVCIEVNDTGKGIKPEFLAHVFDYFRQEDGTITRQFGGLGLGLAIVRHLTEMHGGTIAAESPGENCGATFTVCLPLLEDETEDDWDHYESATFSGQPLKNIRVLLVEDDADNREFATFLLEQTGARVTAKSSAQDALTALKQQEFELLISDIGLPDLDGYELLEQVRSQGYRVPAIALTAYASDAEAQRAFKAGFQRHVAKPVTINQFIATVVSLLYR
jgi:PAS domain S-box-containing protein